MYLTTIFEIYKKRTVQNISALFVINVFSEYYSKHGVKVHTQQIKTSHMKTRSEIFKFLILPITRNLKNHSNRKYHFPDAEQSNSKIVLAKSNHLKSSQVINKCGSPFFGWAMRFVPTVHAFSIRVMALILYTGDFCDSFISSRISVVCAGKCELN